MKINLFGCILFLTLVSGTVLCAGDPWEDKPPSKWSSEDINKLLAKSPWVKGVTVRHPSAVEFTTIEPDSINWKPIEIVEITVSGQETVRMVKRKNSAKWKRSPVILQYTLVWLSAPAVQYALAAQESSGPEILNWWWGPRKELFVSESAQNHVILVAGPNTRTLSKLGGAELWESVYLKFGKDGLKIPVQRITYFPARQSALLYFSRMHKTDSGNVRFFCKMGEIILKKNFDLRKMSLEGSPII
jgi:hypothetical protein